MSAARRIRLPFQPEWRARVLSGAKTTTVRTRRYGEPGDEFELDGALLRLVRVTPMPLRAARDLHFREEGVASAREFEEVWRANHPTRGFRGEDQVWVHSFERIT